jgi:RHS repeat-associated protein
MVKALDWQLTGKGRNRIDRAVTALDYDGGGRRLAQSYDPKAGKGGVKRTEYAFDKLDPVAEYDELNGQHDNYYRGEDGQISLSQHFNSGAAGQLHWYHYDRKGDVAGGLTKQNGNAAHNYRYEPYGAVLPENGNFTDPHNHYTLTGKEFDENTGLVWFGARHYEPETGVWMGQDVYRGRLSEPMSLHRFGYVENNPVSYFDVYGWWLGIEHSLLVKKAWGESIFIISDEAYSIYGKYENSILDRLIEQNHVVDLYNKDGGMQEDLEWHFNREPNANIQDAINSYRNQYNQNFNEISKLNSLDSSSATSGGCEKILNLIGRQSHLIEDYYAHAINKKSNGSADTIGSIKSSPFGIDAYGNFNGELNIDPNIIKPSSYRNSYRDIGGEHTYIPTSMWRIEPGDRAYDSANRLEMAKDDTITLFNQFIPRWLDVCSCFAPNIFGDSQ